MQPINNSNVYQPLKLTPWQHRVLKALKGIETNRYPLSEWYCGALYTLDNPHNPDRIAQAAQSLRELLEKLPLVVQGIDTQGRTSGHVGSGFQNMRSDIEKHILEYKKRCPGEWQGQKIDNHLAKALRIVEDYLERNKQPDRKEKIKKAVTSIDPMADRFDSQIRERKRDRLHRLWRRLEDFAHHSRKLNTESFKTCLEELEVTVFDLLAPITAENQRAIQTILNCSDRSDTDIERMFLLIERRGANYVFFFKQAAETADTAWLFHLDKRGYLANPPNAEPTGEGGINYPFWWPIHYLAKIAKQAPDEVIEIVLKLNKVDNPTVYQEILNIALTLHGDRSTKLKPKILESFKLEHRVSAYHYAALLAHWTKEDQASAALELSKILVAFAPDPASEAKRGRRKDNPPDLGMVWETSLEPSPRIGSWDYNRIMSKGVRPLAEKEPYQVVRILIDTTAEMIHLRTHQDDLEKEIDFSEAWCERLFGSESDNVDSKKALVHTLTFACEQVYEKSPDAVDCLDAALRNQPWKIFERLRQHLYAQNPSEQTKPWIRELILNHREYHLWEHRYEFQQMIRSACEYFRESLLSKEERDQIFNAIRSGPSRANHQAWLKLVEEEFTEDGFRRRQRHFHRLQFKPFAPVLLGEYKTYFQELEKDAANPISDEDYPPIRTKGGVVSNRSPRSPETLEKLADEKLLAAINEWEGNEIASEGNSLVEINLEGLARAFQTVFTKSILTDANRLRFWIENCARIERPIYVRMMIDGMQSDVREKNFDKLNEWLTFCEWVLSKPNERRETDYRLGRQGDESRENPDWYNSREMVGDFIDTCFEKDLDVPVTARGQIAKLLEMLCTQFDRHLDPNMFRDNLIDKAINSVRGRALRTLAKFGYWLRRYDSASQLPEITTILEKRFAPKTEHSLTLPEYAILGRDYRFFFTLNDSWATEHRPDFFPQGMLPAWLAAFSSFLHHNPPFERTFEIFRDDFDFALQYLIDLKKHDGSQEKEMDIIGRPIEQNNPEEILIDSLSHHLFCYYLWEMYPLKGSLDHDEHLSRLEQFYQVTTNNREQWANLFYYVGDLLFNTEHLPKEFKDRIITFFDWRISVKEPAELQQFTGWLEAECLDAEWRLEAFGMVLDVCQKGDLSTSTQVEVLCKLLPDHPAMVMECFAKLTDGRRDGNIFIYTEEAKNILNAGLASDDQNVKQNAKLAHENLLRLGRFDLLDLND